MPIDTFVVLSAMLITVLIVVLIAVLGGRWLQAWLTRQHEQLAARLSAQHELVLTQRTEQHQRVVSEGLANLHGVLQTRLETERQTAEAVAQMSRMLAGSKSRGNAGEHIIAQLLQVLPAEWRATNIRIGGKVVEFALRLPNGRIVPIDSKWPGVEILSQLEATPDAKQQQALIKKLSSDVEKQALDLQKYLDPDLTMNMGIAVVPDAVFVHCAEVQVRLAAKHILLIGQSGLIPQLMLLMQFTLVNSRALDAAEIARMVQRVQGGMEAMQQEIEGRLSKAIGSVEESCRTLRTYLSRSRSELASLLQPEVVLVPVVDGNSVVDDEALEDLLPDVPLVSKPLR